MELIQGRHGIFEVMTGDRIVSESLRWYGEWAENEINILRRFISEGSVFVDVGAFIGTHTVALGRAVGFTGCVHAFEPRPEVHAILKRNVERNGLGEVVLHQAGVSDELGQLTVSAFEPGAVTNPGGLSLEQAATGVTASIVTIDSLGFDRVDLIKIDVEGMEAQVIRGARETIEAHRPVVFAECNTMEGAKDVIESFSHANYSTLGTSYAAYNPNNFRQNSGNIFGVNRECAILFIPNERLSLIDVSDMVIVTNLDDIVGLLLNKPQYVPEILPYLDSSRGESSQDIEQSERVIDGSKASDETRRRPLHIIFGLPPSDDIALDRIADSLIEHQQELEKTAARVYLCGIRRSDDLSEPLGLRMGSAAWETGFLRTLSYRHGDTFAGICNRALELAVAEGADVLLVTPTTRVLPGTISEIVAVGELDPMFGVVEPRSDEEGLSAERAYSNFISRSQRLSRYTLVPSLAGTAVLIKWVIIAELGGFTEASENPTVVINDLVLRANRLGYRAVKANRAFAFAGPGVSMDVNNVLLKQYPEFEPLVSRYQRSSAYLAERLLDQLSQPDQGKIIAFDLSNFGAFHNGTFESGISLVKAAVKYWPSHIRLATLMSRDAWLFHGLEDIQRLERIDPDSKTTFAAVVRIGQPFHVADLRRMFLRAPVVGIFMLDTISADCGYLALKFDPAIWSFALGESDVIFTNSDFTLERIKARYCVGSDVEVCVSHHSLDPEEYRPSASPPTCSERHIFVVGNEYAHKFVKPTVDAIVSAHPDLPVLAVGYPGTAPSPSVTVYAAGSVDNDTFELFYAGASIVVFPSHYEGFGFPIFHALARKKPVFVRDSLLVRELRTLVRAAANIHVYDSTKSLVEMLAALPSWIDEEQNVPVHRWKNSAIETWWAIDRAMTRAELARVQERLDRLPKSPASDVTQQTDGYRISARLAPFFDRLLKVTSIRITMLWTARIGRRLKALLRTPPPGGAK